MWRKPAIESEQMPPENEEDSDGGWLDGNYHESVSKNKKKAVHRRSWLGGSDESDYSAGEEEEGDLESGENDDDEMTRQLQGAS